MFKFEAIKEYLPGGEFYELESDDVRGVPTHNKFCERMFGYWVLSTNFMYHCTVVSYQTAETHGESWTIVFKA